MPDIGPSAAGAAEAAAAAAQASVGGPNPGPGPTYPLPELYVNQLQSSSVRWRELRTVVRQEAGEGCRPATGCMWACRAGLQVCAGSKLIQQQCAPGPTCALLLLTLPVQTSTAMATPRWPA